MLTALLALAGYGYLYSSNRSDRPIHSDGVSYYQYLPAWFIDFDPTFETQARDCCYGYPVEVPIGIHRWPETGSWLAVHPIGVAILMLPFFLAAHALSWWSNLPRDGFSFYYQYIVGLAGLVYVVAGLAVLRRQLLRHFGEAVVLATLVCITFGTNLFHYAVFDATFSHAFSFFLIASLLLLTELWWESAGVWKSALLGFVSALVVLVRHSNVIVLAVVPLYGVNRWPDLTANWSRLRSRMTDLAVMVSTASVSVSPQLWLYKRATGHWFVSSYPGGFFTFSSPHVFGTLFSVERGVFFWSPILLFSIGGMVVAWRRARGLAAATALIFAADTYVMSSWYMWDLGVGYGHRGYVDLLSLLALYLAMFFDWASERPHLCAVIGIIATAEVALSVAQTWQYWAGVIPGEKTTWEQYRAFLGRLL